MKCLTRRRERHGQRKTNSALKKKADQPTEQMFHDRQRTAQPHSWHISSHQETPKSMHASGTSGPLPHVATEARVGHSQYTSVQYSLFTSAERTSCAWLKGQHGLRNHGLHFIFVRLKRICHLVLHVSHLLLFSHLPFTTSTSSRHQESQWREDLHSGGNPRTTTPPKKWRRRSPSSDHRRSGGIWRGWDSWLTRF